MQSRVPNLTSFDPISTDKKWRPAGTPDLDRELCFRGKMSAGSSNAGRFAGQEVVRLSSKAKGRIYLDLNPPSPYLRVEEPDMPSVRYILVPGVQNPA